MKKIFIITLVMTALMTTSCIATRSTTQINKVQVGMSKEEITQLLGKPYFKNGDNAVEQWVYRKMIGEVAEPEEAIFLVNFDKEGRVVGYETVMGRSPRRY